MARNTSYFLLVWGYFLESVECDLVTLIVKLVTVKMKTQNCVIVEVHWCVMLRRKYNLKCTINHYYIELCVNVGSFYFMHFHPLSVFSRNDLKATLLTQIQYDGWKDVDVCFAGVCLVFT